MQRYKTQSSSTMFSFDERYFPPKNNCNIPKKPQNNIRKKTKGAGGRSTALMGLLEDGSDAPGDVRVVDHAWRGAEAYHFLMLCQATTSTKTSMPECHFI